MVVADGVVAHRRCQEIAWNQLGALVDELVKCVLSVGAGLAPDHRTCLPGNGLALSVHIFAVRLHVPLLKISREAVHVLVVGQNGFGFSAEEIVVPDADEGEESRQILRNRRCAEMLIHGMGTFQQLAEAVKSYHRGNAQPDGRPEGIAPADPVPEPKHVGRVNAKGLHSLAVGGKGHKMLRNV